MKSSLEIAQEATLRPIAQIAEEIGLREDEFDLYGRYKAKVSLSVLEPEAARLAAERATEADRAALAALLDELEAGGSELMNLDERIHRARLLLHGDEPAISRAWPV